MIGGLATMAIGVFIGVAIATLIAAVVVMCMNERRPPSDHGVAREDDER